MLFYEWTPVLLLLALALDAVVGDPDWLWRSFPHPVVIMGRTIERFDLCFNRPKQSEKLRRNWGMAMLAFLVAASIGTGLAIAGMARLYPIGIFLEVVVVAALLAQRSLYQHVAQVSHAFKDNGLDGARRSVAMIVGRDPDSLDSAGICRASIESAAENFSDGVVAPAFWYLIAGLPGIICYKIINTADSMVGHRTPRHAAFGWGSARLDDIINVFPSRSSGLIIAIAAAFAGGSTSSALQAMARDAYDHRSPNAGWPEAAMAGALGLALAGPRSYEGKVIEDTWMNKSGRQSAEPADIDRALRLLICACGVQFAIIAAISLVVRCVASTPATTMVFTPI
ncbi:MAG: adenosylcobinamide-phosphate synthase CbiB [Hyphomicrobiaceae bacterium]